MHKGKQVVLIILDGWGYREEVTHNAIAQAKTPHFKRIWDEYPHTLLEASGLAVGLPEGQMGNSEIGHTTIGAGKVIDTDLVRIGKAIRANEFISNPAFKKLFDHVKKHNSTLHIKGLLGKGGVHAHSDHLHAFLRAAKEAGIEKVAIHAFTDGRDTPPQSAAGFLEELEKVIEDMGIGFIATATGRFYAMDRDNNWDRVKKAEDAVFEGKGRNIEKPLDGTRSKPSQVIAELYKEGIIDEHIEPTVFLDDNGKSYKVEKNDGVFFFNFRSDRARQLSRKIVEKKDSHNICFVTLTEYDPALRADVAFTPISIETTLAAEIAHAGLTQAHIAETEKFPHATYFLNGGKQNPHSGEVHIMLDSRKDVQTHDLAPKMRAEAIADKAVEEINKGTNFIFINFANPDMVGHTANVPAIIEAVQEVDTQLGKVISALEKNRGIAFVTADHGNAEVNIDSKTGEKHTAHTINLVPAIVTKKDIELRINGGLADIAPTILNLLDISQPVSMTGKNLIA
ncbi:2,3-bisphosphoglycerate-independent phosphoglycerate mutase [Candidatus Parcubacteria bacterium]|nr:2,3-bisphosphoglycerate-independent phosphoglycerate mutase [Candidatus Parcubacteria bacterium]